MAPLANKLARLVRAFHFAFSVFVLEAIPSGALRDVAGSGAYPGAIERDRRIAEAYS
jgi:hypothetical protein